MSDPWNYHINLGTENGRFLARWYMYTKYDDEIVLFCRNGSFSIIKLSLLKAMSNLPKEHV